MLLYPYSKPGAAVRRRAGGAARPVTVTAPPRTHWHEWRRSRTALQATLALFARALVAKRKPVARVRSGVRRMKP